ncbi:MAG: hypothetical protein II295_11025 [Akkermansia sp.]|nr:hypothetical protein [Akkermansia sp.]
MSCRHFYSLLLALCCLLLASCQYTYVSGKSLGLRDYPDSVVHINQVDPAYRGYFASQHGSSYSLRDQRKAFTQARETARTPVSESGYRPAASSSRRAVSSRRVVARRGRTTVSRGRATVSRGKKTAVSKKKPVASKKKAAAPKKKAAAPKKKAAGKKPAARRRR